MIKSLNEEKRIAVAIKSALDAVSAFNGEVILADSCSSDRTIEIAKQYPIRIVQLEDPTERCCGIGPQLGFQHSVGEYVYILDGDMEILPGFMDVAVTFLDANPEFAGVGGLLLEMNTESLEYISRVERASSHVQLGEVDRLDSGGLYRRKAIKQVGYFSNRNLHSYEEYDLGVRLRAAGWKLQRLDVQSIRHYGHDVEPYSLLLKRWNSGYICGLGEMVRAAHGERHLGLLITEVRELRVYFATLCWLLICFYLMTLTVINVQYLTYLTSTLLLPEVVMAVKKKSVAKGFYSLVSWVVNLLGIIRGVCRNQKSCLVPIKTKEIK